MEEYESEYYNLKPRYDALLSSLKFTIEKVISDSKIELFSLDGRVKTLQSIKEKLLRKKYSNPLGEIEDICGFRIVCYYASDMDGIENLIKQEFNVIKVSDKRDEAGDDKFGYLSRHYIVTLKPNWLDMPLFRDYDDFKVEIQLRTILMHTWAAISHKLLYKRESDAPNILKRKLNRLSALIELADEQFDDIKELKRIYSDNVVSNSVDKDALVNSDGIISLVNKYSPGRIVENDEIPNLVDDLVSFNLTLADLEKYIIKALPFANDMEKELVSEEDGDVIPLWHVSGFVRAVLDLTCEDYYLSRWGEDDNARDAGVIGWVSAVNKYKQKMVSHGL